jgi:CheY-like chemotaxis protein
VSRQGKDDNGASVPIPVPTPAPSQSAQPADPHRDVAGALHNVSNALTVILGWVAEARAEGASQESIHYALGVVEERARAARDLSRRAIGVGVDIDRDDALQAIMAEVMLGLKVEAQRAGVRLVVSGDGSARVPRSDDLSQVVTNLVMNAIAFSPRGAVVTVRMRSAEPFNSVDVEDEGSGVPESRRATLFSGRSTREGGAGVGLRHALALSRAVGGDLELVSGGTSAAAAGGRSTGAHFRVTWPRVNFVPPPPVSVPRKPLLEGKRVLLVEDDADVTQLLEAALGARGAAVSVARSFDELTDLLAAGEHDAALVDLSPIAGQVIAAFDALRTRIPRGHLVVITGSADALPAAVTHEDVRLVRKPFEVGEIVAALLERPSGII